MASPEVLEDSSSGEACSGGYGELGDFLQEERAEEEEDDELRCTFEQAAQHAQNLAHVATTQQLLYLYARYKQVKVGKCTTSKPGFFDFEGRQKWEAWKSLGDYSCYQAMRDYIETVKKLDPDWTPKVRTVLSRMPQATTLINPLWVFFVLFLNDCGFTDLQFISCRDEDKDIFDYCRENDIPRISHGLSIGTIDVNVADDEGRSLLHWACDRGRTELVSILLFHNAHINMQDGEGQTPLHYASACEFVDIVDMLLEHGADPTLKDKDGFQPHQATDNKEISDMLKQHASFGEHDKPPSL
ncbi:acyl-CoA-binding domain-containing protein 6 [Anomaloglossus baeobatrachus]|uniref:acyl-CoA-binding domain-containing protein 6 n=1 Tax=Anomaloglossus baeobatrachus TaxID=238106 RepID=UPI003F50CAFF